MTNGGNKTPATTAKRRWLRPVIIAVTAAVVLVLALLQPWRPGIDPEEALLKTYENMFIVRSYRLDFFGTTSIEGEIYRQDLVMEYSAPDHYKITSTQDARTIEIIITGDVYYYRGNNINPSVVQSVTGFPARAPKETVLEILTMLIDLETLPNEKINGIECLHYRGRRDVERQVEENRDALLVENPDLTEEQLDELTANISGIDTAYELWIGRFDYLLRRVRTEQTLNDEDGTPGYAGATMRFSRYNHQVSITVPEDADGNLLPGWIMVEPDEE